ncbi:hypothetical protein BU25DRAFT_452287 [Macroventuria anomochaeta]|uniref:Uncharacterized protein n=1 Tax=Macroventuria anomochaeta TaxID=301207 RepID=A0ACB6RL20_9PLEO|nr:uncharacterized protein BU25DRAFT_452287 [Macroventuria anomochaeta]KAF2622017.1 hypothetical protein BU25DRAFT_452287 [Macroventuria anomochaeta]
MSSCSFGDGTSLIPTVEGVMSDIIIETEFLQQFQSMDTKKKSGTIQVLVIAIYEIGCLIGAAGIIAFGDKLGRQRAVIVGACIMLVDTAIKTPFGLAQLIIRGFLVLFEGAPITAGIIFTYWLNQRVWKWTRSRLRIDVKERRSSFACLALFVVDRFGCRNLTMFGSGGLLLSLLIIGDSLSQATETNRKPAIAATAFLIVYDTAFAIGWLGVTWLYQAEITSIRIRTETNGFSTCLNWLSNYAVVQLAPIMINRIAWKTYFAFFCFNLCFIPILARITGWWLVMQVRKGHSNIFMPDLHKIYGCIARIAPDQVLVCSEDIIRTAYGAGTDSMKGDWYQTCAAPDKAARVREGEHLDLLTETS